MSNEKRQKTRFVYKGPIHLFEREIVRSWSGYTFAVSERQARNNLSYQVKREFDLPARSPVQLPGVLTQVA